MRNQPPMKAAGTIPINAASGDQFSPVAAIEKTAPAAMMTAMVKETSNFGLMVAPM